MKIGELAAATGTSVRLLRCYEEQGLLASYRLDSGHRRYDDTAPGAVHRIRALLDSRPSDPCHPRSPAVHPPGRYGRRMQAGDPPGAPPGSGRPDLGAFGNPHLTGRAHRRHPDRHPDPRDGTRVGPPPPPSPPPRVRDRRRPRLVRTRRQGGRPSRGDCRADGVFAFGGQPRRVAMAFSIRRRRVSGLFALSMARTCSCLRL